MSLIQTPWTSQPQQAVGIDWGNPITSGVLDAWSAISANITNAGKSGAESGGSYLPHPRGLFRKWAASSDGVDLGNNKLSLPTTGNHGCFAIVTWPSASWRWVAHFQSGGDNVLFGKAGSGVGISCPGVGDRVLFGFTPTAGRTYAIGFSFVRGSNVRLMCFEYETGTYATSLEGSIAPATSASNTWIGRRSTTTAESFAGTGSGVQLVVPFNRAITENEFKSLSQNPWQIFKPLPRRIFAPVATGGNVTITGNIGNATAAGLTATVSQAASIAAGVGNSVAAGSQASIAQQYTLSAGIGNAAAAGLTATITASGLTTISCSVGNAAAAGATATVNSSATITCSAGNAAAAGLTAALDTAYTILANVGNATADGLSATIQAATGISCGVANAIAAGLTASIANNAPLTDSQKIDLILDILSNRQTLNPATGVYTLYAVDGVTVLKTAQAWEDAAGTIPYRGRALQRLDEMN